MKTSKKFIPALTAISATLMLGLGGCAFDEPIDYTTVGDGRSGSGDSLNMSCNGSSTSNSFSNVAEWSIDTICEAWVGGHESDSSGNVYFLRKEEGSGYHEMLVTKYNSSGVAQWESRVGSDNTHHYMYQEASKIVIDDSGNVYASLREEGEWYDQNGNWVRGGGSSITKLNSSGQKQWTTIYTTDTGFEHGYGYKQDFYVDSNGGVYATWRDYDSVESNYGRNVVKLNSSGEEAWNKRFTSGNSGCGGDEQGFYVDSNGNVHISSYDHEYDSDGYHTGYYVRVVKLDSSGEEAWSKHFSTNSYYCGQQNFLVDNSGNVYVTSSNDGYDANGTLTGDYGRNVVKYDSSGQEQWSTVVDNSSNYHGGVMYLDNAGNVYMSFAQRHYNYDDNDNYHYEQKLTKLNSSGHEQWSTVVDNSSNSYSYFSKSDRVQFDSNGGVYVLSHSYDGNDSGNNEDKITKLNSSGQEQWSKGIQTDCHGCSGSPYTDLFVVTSNGDVYYNKDVDSSNIEIYYNNNFIKLNSSGVEVWNMDALNNANHTYHSKMFSDSLGNAYLWSEEWDVVYEGLNCHECSYSRYFHKLK